MKLIVGDKTYKVDVAETEEQHSKGLSEIKELPKNKGMLFVFKEPSDVYFWMKDTYVPLDIIFFDKYGVVKEIQKGEPLSEKKLKASNVLYVLEVNEGSGIEVGDEIEDLEDVEEEIEEIIKDNDTILETVLLDHEGETQMIVEGDERIFSRIHTKGMVDRLKKYRETGDLSDKLKLAKYIHRILMVHEEQEDEYTEIKE